MRHAVRAVPAALAAGLDAARVAHAAVTAQPVLGLPAFAKAETGALPGELAVTVHVSRERAQALFTSAAQPTRALRAGLSVVWSQRGRRLGVARAQPGTRVHASLPAGTTLARGPLVTELRAGSVPVGHAAAGVG